MTPSPGDRLLVVNTYEHRPGWLFEGDRILRFYACTVQYVRRNKRMRVKINGAAYDVEKDGRFWTQNVSLRLHRLGAKWATPDDVDQVREQLTRRKTWDEVSVLFGR